MPPSERAEQQARFNTTRWALVLAAVDKNDTEAFEALSELCRIYWYPLYAYLRRSGHSEHAAEDLTQGFFEHLLSRNGLANVQAEKGRFRSYLLSSLKNYVINEHYRSTAQRRGGIAERISLDALQPAERYRLEPVDNLTPDALFERRWALAVVEQVLAKVRDEFGRGDRAKLFDALKPALLGEHAKPYSVLADEHGLTESAIKVSVHRLRQRFRTALQETVAATVASHETVDEEIGFLINALAPK